MFLRTCCLEKYLTNVMGWLAAVSQVPQPSLSHCLLPVSNGGAGALPLDNLFSVSLEAEAAKKREIHIFIFVKSTRQDSG